MERPGRLSRARIQALKKRIESVPFIRLLGLKLFPADGDRFEMRMKVLPKLSNYMGGVHGGAITSLIDMAVYSNILLRVPEGMTLTTTEVKVNFFRPVTKGILVAKVKIIHSGKRTAVGEAEIEDGEGRLIAKGTAGHLIV